MRAASIAVLLALLLAVVCQRVDAGVRYPQHQSIRRGRAAVLAEREFESQGHFGVEQAVVLRNDDEDDEQDQDDENDDEEPRGANQPGLVEMYANADRGQRAELRSGRTLERMNTHFTAPELEAVPGHQVVPQAQFSVPPMFRAAAELPPPPDSMDASLVDIATGVYETPAMTAARQHAAMQLQAQAPQAAAPLTHAHFPAMQMRTQPAQPPFALLEQRATFAPPPGANLHNHMHVFQGPPSALAQPSATYSQGNAQATHAQQAFPRFSQAAMPVGYPAAPPQFAPPQFGASSSMGNFQFNPYAAAASPSQQQDAYYDFRTMQAMAAGQRTVGSAPVMPNLPPPPVGVY